MQTRAPGSYIEDPDGNLAPNLNDEAMAKRHAEKQPAAKKEKPHADAKE